ncbi:MAG: hypothetical protein E7393_07210 [Ruminococcaceae bacterium]|nr:hypothetical protein [Oscillospiraceae bacterium]
MNFSVTREAVVFVFSVLCGGVLYFLYDLLRVIRRASHGGTLITQIQDGIFWILALAVMFYVFLFINRGTVRLYELVGTGLGAVIYGTTISSLVIQLLCRILEFFLKFFNFFLKILLTPLFFTYNILYRWIRFVFRPIKRVGKRIIKRLCEATGRTIRFSQKQ